MSAVLCFAVSCDRAGKDEGGGDEPTELTPSVKIATGESGEDFLTFTLIPENAAEVRYIQKKSIRRLSLFLLPDMSSLLLREIPRGLHQWWQKRI